MSESDSHALARSRQGHAATSGVDRWVAIQENTFRNWVNEQIRPDHVVEVLTDDFDNGIKLCALVEALQRKKVGRVIKNPRNHHQQLENVALALNAIANDNIRLVNIGPEDIVTGNLKLILGLIWHLILRYQIGKSKFPPKKLMIYWLQAVIPECNITNFTSCWNDGIALHALIDYCRPGLCPDWRNLSRSDRLDNCRNAMTLAKENFGIPLVVRPEDLSSPDLDELSGMTYLSYFMKLDSPGYHATMRGVQGLIRDPSVTNFTTDWQDGRVLCKLVHSVGGNVAGWPALSSDPVANYQLGISAAEQLGIEQILTAKEMADPEVDHIGIMAYAAYFNRFKPVRSAAEKAMFASLPSNVFVGQETSFTVRLEDNDVGPGDIRADVHGPDSAQTVHFNWSGRSGEGYFTPTETGHHKLNVYCEHQLINGCPASFRVLADRSRVTFTRIDRCTVGMIQELTVDTANAGQGDVQIEARSPSGRVHNLSAVPRLGSYITNFNPSEVGDWTISVMYDGEHISGSPYTINVYDPSQVRVYGLEGGSVGTAMSFHADTSKAGSGDLRCTVTTGGSYVPSQVIQEYGGLYKIDFTPSGSGVYKVEVFYDDVEVRGSPFTMEIVDSSNVTVSGDGLSLVAVNKTACFTVDTHASGGKVDVEIIAPGGQTVPYNIVQDGTEYRVEYTPFEIGDYRIEVKYADREISGSPFIAKAYDTSAIEVVPPKDGCVGEPIDFWIDVTKAGEGQLEIMVNNGNLPNTVEAERTGVYKMSFTPEEAGRQTVEIIFNKEQHPGSPFYCNCIDVSGARVTIDSMRVAVDRVTSFKVYSESTAGSVTVDVISPNGDRINADILPTGSGDYRVEWTPRIAGRHSVNVQFAGREVEGSPFYVDVFDLATIRIDNFRHGLVGDDAGFSVDFSAAGQLEHEIRIESPSMNSVSYDTRELGYLWKDVIFEPEESGVYKIYITYGGFVLPGCPYTMQVEDGGMPTASGDGLYFGEEDKPAVFKVDVGKSRKGDLKVKVDGPNSIAKVSVDPQSDGTYTITYIPVETGIFDVSVTWNNADISGSPFHPKVVDPRKVKVIGGWQHFMDNQERITLIVGEEKSLPFDISEAGPGTLRAEVNGPTRSIPVQLDTHTMGKCVVYFTPEEEGNHYIHLFWSDCPLVGNPLLGYAVPVTMDANKVILTGRGLKEATVREEAEFMIDGSQAGRGSPEVTLSGVRAEINVKVINVGNGRFRCSYIPVIPGAYLLHITWNGRQLRGSPYKVNIIGAFYPNRVIVAGEGLHGGILGREMEVSIDTRKAGPGELTASCMGPHQPAYCELEDGRDGTFRLRMKPQESGRHVMQVKYGGEHVQGSPFILKVMAQPDAGKVRVTGPGVEHGILAQFQSRFIVETRGAGAGQLTVRIRGPKGSFQVEMYRDSQKDRTILCRYDPTECGLYIISIKWSGMDVPGSPFHVHIVDTQQELEQVLNESSLGASTFHTGSTPRMGYSQWRAEI